MAAKNVLQKHWNGTEWVEIHPVTKASNVFTAGGQTIEQTVDAHKADDAQEHQRLAEEDVRLRKVNANLQREVAYLKLKQEAADRIEGGTTFADDMNGNIFGAVFDEVTSTNVVRRNRELLMLAESIGTIDRQDTTVVASAFDTRGSGGRKLVRLENGWLVAGVMRTDNSPQLYLSKDDGTTWILFKSIPIGYSTDTSVKKTLAIVNKGNFVYTLASARADYVSFSVHNVEAETNVQWGSIVTTESGVDNVSLTINEAGTELHAAWASKNALYPNSFNIYYAKGTINADGSVTWGAMEQLSILNNASYQLTNPSIIVNAGGLPVVLVQSLGMANASVGSITGIIAFYKTGSNWQPYSTVYHTSGTTYIHASPSAIFVPQSVNGLANGRIWVVWSGSDSTDANDNVQASYSDDGGVTWSARVKLTSGPGHSYSPAVTANKNNVISILYIGYNDTNYQVFKIENTQGTWGARSQATSLVGSTSGGNSPYPSALFDNTFNLDFSSPLFIYKDVLGARVGFYGIWSGLVETPTTTATAVYTLDSAEQVGAFVKKEGAVTVQAYINDVLMDAELVDNEYEFIKGLAVAAPITLRLELSRPDTSGGNNDKLTRLLGGVA